MCERFRTTPPTKEISPTSVSFCSGGGEIRNTKCPPPVLECRVFSVLLLVLAVVSRNFSVVVRPRSGTVRAGRSLDTTANCGENQSTTSCGLLRVDRTS